MTFKAISGLVFLAIVLTSTDAKSTKANKTITLEDILTSKYAPLGYNGKWIADDQVEYRRDSDIYVYNVRTGSDLKVLDDSLFDGYPAGKSFSYSPDRNFVLITYDVEPKWRYSSFATYVIYDTDLLTFEKIEIEVGEKLALFQWAPSPTEDPGSAFVVVHNNDIYYRDSAVKPNDPINSFTQLTHDGSGDRIISNGLSDWVYEEEMLGSSSALWFSNDANKLAFIKFDDTDVGDFQYPIYSEPDNPSYPDWIDIRYPKTNTTNPTATLHVVDLTATEPVPREVIYNPIGQPENRHYIATVKWLTEDTLLVVHLNRAQNIATYYVCTNALTVTCVPKYEQRSDAWIDVYTPLVSNDGRYLMTILPSAVEPGVTYRQVVRIDLEMGTTTEITKQHFSVGSILGWDQPRNRVYFSATRITYFDESPNSIPSSTHIYSVVIGSNARAQYLTSTLENSDGEGCESNGASFSSAFTYWIHSCSGPGIPEITIRENTGTFPAKRVVQDNANLRTLLAEVDLPTILPPYEIPIPNSNRFNSIQIKLIVPADFDEHKKYPLLIDVYGGPGSQTISDAFRIDWGTSLVSDKKIIYGMIDGRGSAGQTQELLNSVYRRLGTYEVQDQIDAVKWLIRNHEFIDANHTGIWGWSYGGFASAMALAIDTENTFKCAMSVAPVTSWLYYDTIYTERFMGLPTPADNEAGYRVGQVLNRAEAFRNKEFLLVHGNADDNVHYQQSMLLTRALEKADIIFDQISYPDEAHSILGTRNHLYHSFERFLFRSCLKQEDQKSGSERVGTWIQLTVASLLAIWCRIALA